MESSVSLGVYGSDAQSKQVTSSLNQHGDVVAAADGVIDVLRVVHLGSVDLHHDVSRDHASSKTNAVELSLITATLLKPAGRLGDTEQSYSWFVC